MSSARDRPGPEWSRGKRSGGRPAFLHGSPGRMIPSPCAHLSRPGIPRLRIPRSGSSTLHNPRAHWSLRPPSRPFPEFVDRRGRHGLAEPLFRRPLLRSAQSFSSLASVAGGASLPCRQIGKTAGLRPPPRPPDPPRGTAYKGQRLTVNPGRTVQDEVRRSGCRHLGKRASQDRNAGIQQTAAEVCCAPRSPAPGFFFLPVVFYL